MIDTPRARVRTVAGVALICAALATGCGPSPAVPSTADGATTAASPAAPTDPESYAAELFRLTNELRAREGLPVLAGSTCAEDVAVERASALVGAESLEHAPMDDVLARCAPSTHAAENLGRAEATPAEVVTAWEGSFGHLENLLSETATSLGVGCVPDGAELLCSQIFLGP